MNPLTWQNPGQLFVAQDIIKVKIYSVAELRIKKKAASRIRLPCTVKNCTFFRGNSLYLQHEGNNRNYAKDRISPDHHRGVCTHIRYYLGICHDT